MGSERHILHNRCLKGYKKYLNECIPMVVESKNGDSKAVVSAISLSSRYALKILRKNGRN